MSKDVGWEYIDQQTYRVLMSSFDQNCMSLGSNPLLPIFDIKFDSNLKNWISSTKDVGYAGLRANSGNPYSDMYRSYPHDLNKWDGIPKYMNYMEPNHIPEHMAIYALHNSPNYSEQIPDSRQTAALLFDLGEESKIAYDYKFHYVGYSGEIPPEEETGIPVMYMDLVRYWGVSNYTTTLPSLIWNNYVAAHPQGENETWNEWQTRLKDGWTSTEQKNPEYRVSYDAWVLNIVKKHYPEYAYSVYEDPSTRDRFEFNQDYVDEVIAESGTPHDVLTSDEFDKVFKMMITSALHKWNSMDKDMYVKMDNWFGVIVTDSSQVSDDLILDTKIVDCYDDNDGTQRFICKMIIGLYSNKEIRYMSILRFGFEGDVYIDEKVWHIVHAYNAADHGAEKPMEEWEDWQLQFDLHLLEEVNDIGRVYVLSNDDTSYVNNKNTAYPKPDRTVARICDIPTSIVQLTGISGVAPVSVVDPKYVRTELSYTSEDKNKLYNDTKIHWVRPTYERAFGVAKLSDNDYVFSSVDDLKAIDMMQDDVRELLPFEDTGSFNVVIDPMELQPGPIVDNGNDYKIGDIGLIYIGGFAIQYGVEAVNSSGGVTKFSITPVKQGDLPGKDYPNIPLSNFDMGEANNGNTSTYGTSPLNGDGTGFRCKLYIPNIERYTLSYGKNYNDLFAMVKHSDGLWLYEYNTESCEWEKTTQLSRFENVSATDTFQTTTDAYMSFVLPTKQKKTVCQYYDGRKTVDLAALCTSTFVNIIDQTHTPIQTDVTSSADPVSITNEVDFCKFRCDGFKRYVASTRTWNAAYQVLEKAGVLEQDCYIAFKWVYENDKTDGYFYAGIIKRSFNHVLATNDFSMLPENAIPLQNGINSNASTTIVWDVPNVGPMMWVFNPNCIIHEKYHIDQQRQSFYIERTPQTWDTIDICPSPELGKNDFKSLFDANGKLLFDIYTNSPYARSTAYDSEDTSIYKLPKFSKLLTHGILNESIPSYQYPTGNWICVFPRVNGFVFEKDDERHIPLQMQAIHSNNVITTSKLINEATNQDESSRTIIFEDTLTNGIRAKVFNSMTSTWDTI
jgi:hypothetical protein